MAQYTELTGPFAGWSYDDAGTVYSPSGYRCTGQLIECALWLFGMLRFDMGKRPIFADTAIGATRQLYDINDARSIEYTPAEIRVTRPADRRR
jgi:hypothetical protein